MVCIGYVGMEAFDIILYIGQTLAILHYPVLIIDLSDTGALKKAIHHGMDIDSRKTIVHYRGLNYVRCIPHEKVLDEYGKGVVFVNYGMKHIDSVPFNLDIINVVVDSYPSNVDRVNGFLNKIQLSNLQVRLLIRDIITLDDVERISRNISPTITWSSSTYLYLEIKDYENAIKCQTNQSIRFSKISSRMRKLIKSEIENILPNIKVSRIKRATYLARKGGI